MARRKKSGRRVSTTVRTRTVYGRSSPQSLEKLAKELHTTTPEKETIPVSDTPPPNTPTIPPSAQSLRVIADRLDSLEQRIEASWERINVVHTNFGLMSHRVAALENRLVAVEATLPKRDEKDTITGAIYEFLRRNKGLKFNSGSLAANVEGLTSKNASTLAQLVMNKYPDAVKFEKREGESGMYWYEEAMIMEVKNDE